MHPLPAEPACLLQSPVLIMLASADGLTGAALSAAEALRPAPGARRSTSDSLASTGWTRWTAVWAGCRW